MTAVAVTHFADAGCPWDYSAEPVRFALEQRYGDQLTWQTVQVGLHENAEVMADKGYTTAGLAESHRRFHARYGMPFCVIERPRLLGTWPGARAVKAAETQGVGLGARFQRRLRLAWFVETRLVDEPGELVTLARDVDGLDAERLAHDLRDEGSGRALAGDMARARRPDRVALALDKTTHPKGESGQRYTTPTYLFEHAGRQATVPGFQSLGAYEIAMHNLAPHLERRPPPTPVEFLQARPGEFFAAVEVAAATGRRRERVEEDLRAVGAQVRHLPVGLGELLSWGSPRAAPRCSTHPPIPEDLHRGELLAGSGARAAG